MTNQRIKMVAPTMDHIFKFQSSLSYLFKSFESKPDWMLEDTSVPDICNIPIHNLNVELLFRIFLFTKLFFNK